METPRRPTSPIAKALALAIVIFALTGAGYVFLFKGPAAMVRDGEEIVNTGAGHALEKANQSYDLARRIGKDLDGVFHFHPKVTSGGTTLAEASHTIAELSLVEKPLEYTYPWESTWLGSTKRLKVKAYFVARAGYDLSKPFSIDVSEDGQSIRATLPPPKITSLEQTRVEVLQDENGTWNKISPEERQAALNALLAGAREALAGTTILADTEAAMMAQLERIIHQDAPSATIVRDAPATP